MANLPAIANLVNTLPQTKFELHMIGTNARGLSTEGRELMPVKADMLAHLPPDLAAPCLDACQLLFAAILMDVEAELTARDTKDALAMAIARMNAGKAEGTICALFFGSTALLLLTAAEHAPIAFHSMCKAAPRLKIADRLKGSRARACM